MNTSLDTLRTQTYASNRCYDAVIIGAGPYGLAIAAHMQEKELSIAVLGKPLHLWREYMPQGMLLRSYWWATNISDPYARYDLKHFFHVHDLQEHDPLGAETFIQYGLWFQQSLLPSVDETYMVGVEQKNGMFEITLADGRVVQSATIVMACGLAYYSYIPQEYEHLPAELVSHTSQHRTFDGFTGKRVVVIGGGQSALETAALAYESGAEVQLVARRPIVWLKEFGAFPVKRPLIQRLRAPKAGIAPGWFNWRLEHFPYAFQQLPRARKDALMQGPGRYGPMGAAWLKPRLEGNVPLHESVQVQELHETDAGVKLVLSTQKILEADHVILGTGYRVAVAKLPMLSPEILSRISTYHDAPVLNNRFESSIPGLYFVGISSVSSCGPLYRFVVGTAATARRVTDSVAKRVASMR